MARQDANEIFRETSFLYGSNASYIEDLYARFEDDPASVPEEWRSFFSSLQDEADNVRKAARGASWKNPDWPIRANGELISALDGDWGTVEKHVETRLREKAANGRAAPAEAGADVMQQTRDSVRAIMMIRAYRMRGHLHAKLDPLGIAEPKEDYNELDPETYGFSKADYDRKIFLDNVLGPRVGDDPRDAGDPRAHLLFDDRRRVHAHLRSGGEGLDPAADRGSGQGHRLHREGQDRHSPEADRGGRLRAVHRRQVQGHQALRPRRRGIADPGARADHKARRFDRPQGNRARHGPPRPPERALAGDAEAAPGDLPRVQGRLLHARRGRRARETSSTTSALPPTASSTATRCTCR